MKRFTLHHALHQHWVVLDVDARRIVHNPEPIPETLELHFTEDQAHWFVLMHGTLVEVRHISCGKECPKYEGPEAAARYRL